MAKIKISNFSIIWGSYIECIPFNNYSFNMSFRKWTQKKRQTQYKRIEKKGCAFR